MKIDQREALRYLGYKGSEPDAEILCTIADCARELEEVATPHHILQAVTLSKPDADTLEFAGMVVHSRDLFQHLSGCEEAVLFAATLGAPVDLRLERCAKVSMSRAVVMQACAASLIESYCDECQEPIAQEAASRGLYLRPRYSPGYGDFDISYQREFLTVLDCPKRIGLTMTDSFMLAPSKSVTAVIGLTAEAQSCHIAKCMTCKAKSCPFRKD
ncbi:MAG: Vitamin B12 dependent methionine synthase activation subunit [Clostridium sp.]|nr:Vitamin B12 dependent methionine synthase activation subunit [Clostridium sp.]